ncbi:MAG: chemoreceptor glutamine deamidase CheD [Gammaproteobacteria bacterium]
MALASRRQAPCPKPPALPGFEAINRYWDPTREIFCAKILPGEYYVTTTGEGIVTVLGSCVSACIRDRLSGIGGMNHFMLPEGARDDNWASTGVSAATRYGTYAMEHMINDILKAGGRRDRFEIKIVGGGRILANVTDIGRRNIEFVRQYLAAEGLVLAGEDVGDICPRKVVFLPATGKVQVKKLNSLHNDTILTRETQYQRNLTKAPVAGDVELF